MDLGAFQNIEVLDGLAKDNGIDIPRCRGYRLMKDEVVITQAEIDKLKRINAIYITELLIDSDQFWCGSDEYADICIRVGAYHRRSKGYFLVPNKDEKGMGEYSSIRWDRIHGWKRRILKFKIKQDNRKIQKQFDTWNKYAGRKDVLYIHSRIGGYDQETYLEKGELINQPWFLDRVDDSIDSTYCDFYAKINILKDEGENNVSTNN